VVRVEEVADGNERNFGSSLRVTRRPMFAARYQPAGVRWHIRRAGRHARIAIRKKREQRSGRTLKEAAARFRPGDSRLGDGLRSSSRTHRNPRLSFRSSGSFLLRFDTRRFCGSLFQEPPRTSDRAPDG